MLFDTLELSKALQASFTPEQAETLVQALGKASVNQVATKADIAEVKREIGALRVELKGEIGELRAELKSEVGELKGELAASRSEFHAEIAALKARLTHQISQLRADTIRWIVTAIGFNFLGTAGLIVTLTKILAH